MRPITAAALIALACAGAPAFAAQPTHLSDAQFVQANRCLGLMTSKTIGTPDAAAMKQLINSQTGGRVAFIYDRADEARDDAQRQASHAGADNANLIAERDGVCRSLIGSGSQASGPHAASQMLR